MGHKIAITDAGPDGRDNAAPLHYRKIALVCEGGGQRGIFTAGVLDEFMRHDFLPFELMIGTSAGAQNLSAYACGQPGYARHVISRLTTTRQFFDPVRFLRGGHLIDLDWLIDTTSNHCPLDMSRARQRLTGRELLLCACRSDDLRPTYFPIDQGNWLAAIKASSAMPWFYRDGAEVDGINYVDGGVSDAVPVREAHRRGADLIVVIRTTPSLTPLPSDWRLRLRQWLSNGQLRRMIELIEAFEASYLATQAFIDHPPDDVCVLEIAPSAPLASTVLASTQKALRTDYHAGRHCGECFMSRISPRLQPH